MAFDKQLITVPRIKQIEFGGKRFYVTPDGQFRSVTEFLSSKADKDYLDEWRQRVGPEEAERISGNARTRGKIIHKLVEDYILDDKLPDQNKVMPINRQTFYQIKNALDRHLTIVHGVELKLYSSWIKLAGTTDLIGVWDGKLSIIDHKTGNTFKNEQDIEDYFLQCTCYSIMLEELTGMKAKQLVVIIGNNDSYDAQVFMKRRQHYLDKLYEMLNE